jgi:hypothetical protein
MSGSPVGPSSRCHRRGRWTRRAGGMHDEAGTRWHKCHRDSACGAPNGEEYRCVAALKATKV